MSNEDQILQVSVFDEVVTIEWLQIFPIIPHVEAAITEIMHEGERPLPMATMLSPLKQQYVGLLNQGRHELESAEILGLDRKTLYNWRQDPVFVYFWNESRKPAQIRLAQHRNSAIKRLGELLNSNDERVALASCLALLKRDLESAGVKPDQIVEDTIAEIEQFTTQEDRIELARRLRIQLAEGRGTTS